MISFMNVLETFLIHTEDRYQQILKEKFSIKALRVNMFSFLSTFALCILKFFAPG